MVSKPRRQPTNLVLLADEAIDITVGKERKWQPALQAP